MTFQADPTASSVPGGPLSGPAFSAEPARRVVAAHRVNVRHADDVAGRGRVHHLAVADVDAHVADRAVEEDQVAGLQLVAGDRRAHLRLQPAGVRQADAGRGVGELDQPGAVEGARAGGRPYVRLAALLHGGVD